MSDPAIKNNVLPHESTKAKLEAVPDHAPIEPTLSAHKAALSWTFYLKVIVALGILIAGFQEAKTVIYNVLYFESTDDAQISGHSTILNTKVGGIVSKVLVKDNAQVKKGQVLFSLDTREFTNSISQLEAELNAIGARYQHASAEYERSLIRLEKLETPEFINSIKERQAEFAAINTRYLFSAKEYTRGKYLYEQKAIPRTRLDLLKAQASENYSLLWAKKAQLEQAKLNFDFKAAPRTKLELLKSQSLENSAMYWAKKAQLEQAKLNLEYAELKAPSDGVLGKIQIEPGVVVRPQQTITNFIDFRERWVVANFKETQLQKIRTGQKAEIEIDAIEDKVFYGYVESFSPGSGASFSLIPPDNATGNFTKIVQRVSVKIVLDPASIKGFEDRLIPGISANVRVRTRSDKTSYE